MISRGVAQAGSRDFYDDDNRNDNNRRSTAQSSFAFRDGAALLSLEPPPGADIAGGVFMDSMGSDAPGLAVTKG